MKSLFNRQVERFVRERKRYKRWLALFLCLAVMVSSGTYMSLTREGRALDSDAELQAESVSVETDETGAGGSGEGTDLTGGGEGEGTDMAGAGGSAEGAGVTGAGEGEKADADKVSGSGAGQTEADNGKTDADGIGGSGSGSSAGGSGEDGGKPDADGITEGGAGSDADGAGEGGSEADKTGEDDGEGNPDGDMENGGMTGADGAAGNSGKTEESEDSGEDGDAEVGQDEIVVDADETVSGNEEEMTDVDALMTVSDNDPLALTTLQELIDLVKNGSEEDFEKLVFAGADVVIGDNGSLSVTMRQDYTETLSIPDGVELTLDLNGYHLYVPDDTSTSNASGVVVSGSLTLKDSAGNGGIAASGTIDDMRGIYVGRNGIFNMEGGTVSGFRSGYNGAGVYVGNLGTLNMTGGTIENNGSESYGGGIFINTTCQVTFSGGNTVIRNNSAEKGGGIAFEKFPNEKQTLQDIRLEGNHAEKNGGAFHVAGKGGLNVKNVIMDGNTAAEGYGGGICMEEAASNLILTDTQFKNNMACLGGGAVYMKGEKGKESSFRMNGGSAVENGVKAGSATETYGGAFYLTGYTNTVITGREGAPVRINRNHDAWYGGGFAVGAGGSLNMQWVEVNDNTTWALNNSRYDYGGGFFSLSDTEMEHVSVCRNRPSESATYGGGGFLVGNAWNTGKNLTMRDCTVSDNIKGSNGGGGIISYSYLDMENCSIIGNTTKGDNGGGIWVHRRADIRNTLLQNNTAASQGGGIYLSGSDESSMRLTDCEVIENTSGNEGGGVRAWGGTVGTVVTAVNTSFDRNKGGSSGGAVLANILIVEEPAEGEGEGQRVSTFNDNTSGGYGGAIYAKDVLIRQAGVKINGNVIERVYYGGGIYATNNVTIEKAGVEISNNRAVFGGGIFAVSVNLKGTIIKNNTSDNWAGGIYLGKGESVLDGCIISGNKAANGGGVSHRYCGGTLTVKGDTKITDNTVSSYGGGILIRGGTVILEDGEISGNKAQKGGGVDLCTNTVEDGAYEESEFIMRGGSVYDNEASKIGNDIRLDNIVEHTKNEVAYERMARVTLPKASEISTGKVKGRFWEQKRSTGVGTERQEDAYKDFVNESTTANDDIGLTFVYGYTGDAARAERTDGTIKDYPTVNDAMKAAFATGDVTKISLLRNTIEDVVVPEGLTTTLDLNGYTMDSEEASTITVEQGADLMITDSSDGQKGIITGGEPIQLRYKEGTEIIAGLMVYGNATLEKGSIGNNYNENYGTTVYTGAYVAQTGLFTMQGGNICGNNNNKNGRGVMVNEAETSRAGKGATGGRFVMTGGSISGNARGVQLSGDGKEGGLHAVFEMHGSETVTPVIENNTGASDRSSNGTGLYAGERSEVTIVGGVFRNNKGANWGGGIHVGSGAKATLKNVNFVGNSASCGGAVSSNSSVILKIDGCRMEENTGSGGGGALLLWDGGKAEITDTVFEKNGANSQGGVIFLGGAGGCTVKNSIMENNTSASDSGAIRVYSGTLYIENTEISGNKAGTNGGGICVTGGTLNAENVEITDNEAATNGGGIYTTGGTLNITDTMITGNEAGCGGGLYSRGTGNCTVKNTEQTDTAENTAGIYENYALDGKDVYVKNTAAAGSTYCVTLPTVPGKDYRWLDEKIGLAVEVPTKELSVTAQQEYYLTAFRGDLNTESAAQWNGTKYYTVQAAVDAMIKAAESGEATGDGTIYLLRDVAERVVIPKDSNITVDLNHYTMYGWGDAIFTVEGKLIIQDNNNPTIGNDVPNPDAAEGTSAEGAAEDDSQSRVSKKGDVGALRIMNAGAEGRAVYIKENAELVVKGGVVEGFKAGNGGAIYAEKNSRITIEGGTFQNNTATASGGMLYTAVNCELKINGGTFNNNKAVSGGAITAESGCNFTISGGSFEENTATAAGDAWCGGAIYIIGNRKDYPSTLKITGGEFIANTAAGDGGAICMGAGKVEIIAEGESPCIFEGNKAYIGSAVYVWADAERNTKSSLAVSNAIFQENTATNSAALCYYDPKVNKTLGTSNDYEITIKNTLFTNNSGGGASISGWNTSNDSQAAGMPKLLVENCTFTENKSSGSGSGFSASYLGGIKVVDSVFENNTAGGSGGGFYANANKVHQMKTEVTGCTFMGNNATYGGAMRVGNTYAPVRISDSSFTDNHAVNEGGAVRIDNCDLILTDGNLGQNIFTDNTAKYGGAVFYYGGRMELNGGLFERNTSSAEGGAIYLWPGGNRNIKTEFMMNGGTLRKNEASYGGGICFSNGSNWQSSSLTINGGEISHNTARSGNGGGIYATGNDAGRDGAGRAIIYIADGKISSNTAERYGGGICAEYIDSIRISGGEINGNSSGIDAGGVSTGAYVKAVVSGGVITGNSSKQGGGMAFNTSASLELLPGGKVYGNTANKGKDLRFYYSANSAKSVFQLADPSEIFAENDALEANAWYDEIRDAVYKKGNTYKPPRRDIAFTLLYTDTRDTVAMIGEEEYPTVQAAIDAIERDRFKQLGRDIVMVKDSHETVSVPSGVTATLYLNGHTLSGVARAISCSGELAIRDKDVSGATKDYVEKAGDGIGTITGKAYTNGGGIMVNAGGKVTMSDGQIKDAQAESYGGGVYINYGSFVMDENARIVGSRSATGSAVTVWGVFGRFTMNGGEISGSYNQRGSNTNATELNGGGAIYVYSGRAEITDGTIKDNVSSEGSAIYLQSGKVKIEGTETEKPMICNNKATARGGAIRMNGGSLTISNAVLRDNIVTAARSTTLHVGAGGAIYQEGGTIVMEEGTEITNNRAARGGAIFQWSGAVKMQDGEITGNVAELGGGLAQNPENTPSFTMQKGLLAGNLSKATHEGNDVYSLYEGAGRYETFRNTPKATLIKASRMTGDAYDAWRNDVASADSVRVGESINEAEYITGMINQSKGLALTAVNYALELEEEGKVPLRVNSLSIVERQPGADQKKDGKYTHDGTGADKEELIGQERKASDCLSQEGWKESDETYQYNGNTYHYIAAPDGTLYEQNQAVEWVAGSDGSDNNLIVRSFDTVTYQLSYTIEKEKQDAGEKEENEEDPEEELLKDGMTYKLWISADLPYESEQAIFDGTGLDYFQYSTVRKDGKSYQRITGYWEKTYSEEGTAESESVPFVLKVGNLKNGETIRPDFKVWVGGNAWNEENPAGAESQRITVSAQSAYNLRLKRNSELSYTGYFNLSTGEESSAKEMEEAKNDPESEDEIVYGTMMGYGVTLELLNPNSGEGIKGLQLPEGEVSFDMYLKGNLTINSEQKEGDVAPYIWAYKENEKSDFGTNVSNTSNNFLMDWNDEDDLVKVTNYAYDGAPYNSGGNNYSCYSGGSWYLSDYSRNAADAPGMTRAQFHVNGYGFSDMLSGKPVQNSDGVTDPTLNNNETVAFSAGYIQLICPVDYEYDDLLAGENYVEIAMNGVVSDLEVSGAELVSREDDTDLSKIAAFFGEDVYKDHARNETRYADNYYQIITSTNVMGGYGEGNGDIIFKTNSFYTDANQYMQGNERGESSTPLGTDVYIGGVMTYHSKSYDTRDVNNTGYYIENFDPAMDNTVEFNYMTSLNVLQKFDGSVFTPVGAQAIVAEPHYYGDSIGGGAFTIGSNEQNASWNGAQTDKTRRFWLTVLYAAKPDGSNWSEELTPKMKEEKDADGNPVMVPVEDADGNPVMLSDGGVKDMDAHMEEDLIYFKTLEELYQYFASRGEKGTCVGVLYELRDCCVRKDRYVDCHMRVHTTKDFNMTGGTYVTTNDVRYFTTYRPEYKKAYVHASANDHTKENSIWQSGLVNQFSWCDMELEGGACGAENGLPETYGTVLKTEKAQGGLYTHYGEKYQGGYKKTEYENGTKKPGTHTGNFQGNSILLYTLDSDIRITNTDTISQNSNSRREQYDISKKQREANFLVTPSLQISSKIKDYELVKNGTQSVGMKITINLPKHLNYNDNSVKFDYSLPTDVNNPVGQAEAEKAEASMKWDVAVIRNADGTSSLILTTTVADMNLRMPQITYRCTIGEPGSTDDVQANTSLTSEAVIETAYEESGRMTGVSHRQSVTITTIGSSRDSIWKSVGGDDSWNAGNLVDMGDDLVYRLHYRNLAADGEGADISLLDVLPYTGDGRGTQFHGGYQVKGVKFIFDNEEDYKNFIGADTADTAAGQGIFRYQTGVPAGQLKNVPTDLDTWQAIDVAQAGDKVTFAEDEKTVAVDLSDLDLMQSGEKTDNGIALYGKLPTVKPEQCVTVEVTLEPTEQGADKQRPLDVYYNSFSYWNRYAPQPGECAKVSVQVATRSLSGIVWMDQDQNGFYYEGTNDNSGSYQKSADLLMKNVEVYLYTTPDSEYAAENVADGGPGALTTGGKTYYRATDVHGNLLPVQITDAKGQYKFSELGAGRYFVYFVDTDKDYKVKVGNEERTLPLAFSQLSVTKRESEQTEYAVTSNKAYPYYGAAPEGDGLYRLSYAFITNELSGEGGIELPEADKLNQANWNTPNWNLGLYYINQSVEKVWKQTDMIEDGTKVELTESIRSITGKDDSGNDIFGENIGERKFSMTQKEDGAEIESDDYEGLTLTVTDHSGDGKDIIWTVSDIPLQAETAKTEGTEVVPGKSLAVDYSMTTVKECDASGELLKGYIVSREVARETGEATTKYSIINIQVLHDITLTKVSKTNHDIRLGGAEFTVYRDGTDTMMTKAVSDGNGSLTLSGLTGGTYLMKETAAPKGYALDPTEYKIEITYEENASGAGKEEFTCENNVWNSTAVRVTQMTSGQSSEVVYDSKARYDDTTKPLRNAVWTVREMDSLKRGTLYELEFMVDDACIYELPNTGGIGVFPYVTAGTLLLMAAAWLVMRKRREEVLQKGRY